MAVTIREAREDDIASVAAIYADAVLTGFGTFETTPPSEEEMAKRYTALASAGHPYLVAEMEGVVVGYAHAGPYRPRPAYRNTVECSVYVEKESKRRGIGKKLLEALLEASEEKGFRQIVAVIGDSGNTASVALHASCGFAHVGTLRSVGRKHGRWLDTVIAQRPLGRADSADPDSETP
ncbi:GNAT family N-acetyltransferase [Ovoidimarina sediminis]|uniref:GNAT family N-acetyltransferase n=1 Tax=Ovoidimarina sediminis TaxID=3079856 RepID=UPI00290CD7FE|nr:N-acetyltransferase family protein [Rhodophyticola sp. MJ-SS7]MDU8944814.1 GNAT family N-acetyltransferase [Rhodophyticola sp. MJ-SS7]